MKYLWKLGLIVWIVASAGLAWSFGQFLLYGGSPELRGLIGVLSKVWGGCAGFYGYDVLKSKWKTWSARHADNKTLMFFKKLRDQHPDWFPPKQPRS
jgi:hypothetical protein